MPDGWEIVYGLDPKDAADAELDADSDGLTNLAEWEATSIPTLPDSDDDGLSDELEATVHFTDPRIEDTEFR